MAIEKQVPSSHCIKKLRYLSPVEFIKIKSIHGFEEVLHKMRLGSVTIIKYDSNAGPGPQVPYC